MTKTVPLLDGTQEMVYYYSRRSFQIRFFHKQIIIEEINLFTGPLNFQDGSEFLADGEEASDFSNMVYITTPRRYDWRQ